MEERIPRPGELYRHFKGRLYQILTVAHQAETGEKVVVYQALYGNFNTYVRAYDSFMGKTDRVKYPDAVQDNRFELYVPGMPETKPVQAGNNTAEESQTVQKQLEVICHKAEEPEEVQPVEEAQPEEKAQPTSTFEGSMKEVLPGDDINPALLIFLEAEGNAEKIEALYQIRNDIDEKVISAIEASLDLPSVDGEIEDRIMYVRNNLVTRARFEGSHLR